MFLEGQVDRQVDRQTDRRVHRRPTPKQYPSDFIGGGGTSNEHKIFSVMFKNTTLCFR